MSDKLSGAKLAISQFQTSDWLLYLATYLARLIFLTNMPQVWKLELAI